ncbi:MAG TPA: acetoacetate decarboxylase family protein [Candidatus Binatia bacterium]|jgi:acetoacetate decarboxylase|nr:acetoacetate decarboxylase family protein [Candidatus Binatia bacterium]
MNGERNGDRGGNIELSADKPRGLPFLKPLYGPPPYQYIDDIVLIIAYEAEETEIREVLPRELEPLPGNIVAMCFFLCPEVTGIGPHNFTMPCIPVCYGDYEGQFVPYLYTSTDASLACYREGQGWPAVLGQTEITEDGQRVHARVSRNGREIMRATAKIGSEPITSLNFLPIILYKEIPSVDGKSCDSACFLTSTSLFTNLNFKAGTGELVFPDPGDDPVARLTPVNITSALYGTLDDLYPESIRVLKDLK